MIELHPDLLALLSELGSIGNIRAISPLAAAKAAHATFRVDLTDGRTVKGHQLESVKAVDDAVELGQFLPAASFTRILASRGCALVSAWVHGRVLSSRPITRDDCQQAGAILRSVHAVQLPASIPETRDRYPNTTSWAALSAKIDTLCRHGQLTADEGERAAALLREHAPPPQQKQLVHGDLCPDNIVEDDAQGLQVVDNDGVDVHVAAFDVARTWLRWPMNEGEWNAFATGYGHAGGVLDSYGRHFIHWASAVLISSIEFRLQRHLSGTEPLVQRLRDLIAYRLADNE